MYKEHGQARFGQKRSWGRQAYFQTAEGKRAFFVGEAAKYTEDHSVPLPLPAAYSGLDPERSLRHAKDHSPIMGPIALQHTVLWILKGASESPTRAATCSGVRVVPGARGSEMVFHWPST